MNKKKSRRIALAMLLIAVVFVLYAVHHPEQGFRAPVAVVRSGYAIYIVVMITLLVAPFDK